MKSLMTALLAFTLALGMLFTTGCGGTCEKAWKKTQKCSKSLGVGKMKKDQFMKGCKKHEGAFKKCLDKDNCPQFWLCVGKEMRKKSKK